MGYGMSEELGSDGAYFTVERNLFEEAHGEAAEIISIKSNRNVVRFNTFRKTKGGITNRSGNFNVIEGNFILGEGEPRSYGIRVTGQYHRVVNNQVVGVAGAGLLLVTGEFIDEPLTDEWQPIQRAGTPFGRVPRYAQVKHGLFARNRFVDCGGVAIEVGSAYKAGWPRGQQVLLPENNHLVENQIVQAGAADRPALRATRPDRTPPFDRFHFEPNQIEGNVVAGGGAAELPGVKVGQVAAVRDQLPQPADQGRPLTPRDVGSRWLRQRWMTGAGP
jgi:poly(beta-D-mannuronate) lyase